VTLAGLRKDEIRMACRDETAGGYSLTSR
jgi:hypothetical protein